MKTTLSLCVEKETAEEFKNIIFDLTYKLKKKVTHDDLMKILLNKYKDQSK